MTPTKPLRTMTLALTAALFLAVTWPGTNAAAELNSTPRDETCGTNGNVLAIATTPTTIYLGGSFTAVGPTTGGAVPIDTGTAAPLPVYPKVNNYVYACVCDGAGGWYIGGDFTRVGTVMRNRIAHILPDGTVDSVWNPDADNTVQALAMSGTAVYAGGSFTTIGGQIRNRIAALNASTGLATDWNPNANYAVQALAVSDTTVYAGGNFLTIGGQTRNRIAAIDASTGLATTWNPNASNLVYALAVSGATVYAGGDFSTIGGQPRNRIAALDTTTGLATTWNCNASGGGVYALALSGGTVYAGGAFTSFGGQTRNYIAALDASTGLATAWNPNASSTVTALAVSDVTVYIGGWFTTIGGQSRRYIAALDAATGLATTWNPNGSSGVRALALSGTTLYAGGQFSMIGGQTRKNIAAIDAATGMVTAWNPNAEGASPYVYSLAVSGTTVYAGGTFTTIGGQTRNNIAAIDAATGLATIWDPNANSTVRALAVSGTTVYTGGGFTTAGGQTRNRIAALDVTTGLATTWDPNASGTVYSLAVSGTAVYAGGSFTSIGGQARNLIAALDATTGLATVWNPNAVGNSAAVRALVVSGTTVYAGGDFYAVGGKGRNGIAAVDATTGLTTTWNPYAGGTNPYVSALAILGTTVYAGGTFTTIGGQTRNYLAALDATTGLATAWNPNANDYVRALVGSGTTMYVGGPFGTIGGSGASSFAEFNGPPPVAPSNPGATAAGTNSITWTWVDNSGDERWFKVYDDPGSGPPVTLQTTTAADVTSWQHNGLTPNTQYSFQVAASSGADSAKTDNFTAWTLAATPVAPVVSHPTASTLDVAIGTGDGNPAATLYAIHISPAVGGNLWVQADGSVGASAVYRTAADWATTTVSGLAPSTNYTFTVTARNGANVDTGAGPELLVDRTPPVITSCAPNRSLPADAACTALVPNFTGQVVATDDITPSGSLVITQDPAAGEAVTGLGAHTVTLSVKDAAGNAATCAVTLTLTAFDHSASRPAAVPWTTNGTIDAMVTTANVIYVAGAFTWVGPTGGAPETGIVCANLAAVDPVTGAALDWAPGTSGAVTSLALSADGTTLYAGGNGFVDEVVIATEGSTPLITGLSGTVAALAVSDTTLYLGGDFSNYIDAYDLTVGAFAGWTPPAVSGPVYSLAVAGTTLYAGEADGIESVVLEPAGFGAVDTFTVADGPVDALAASCETLYAGGEFATIGGQPRSRLVALDVSGVAKPGWAPAVNGPVRVLAVSNTALCAAGDFTAIGSASIPGFARFAVPSITVLSPNGGEKWTEGTAHQITWRSAGLNGNVRIRLWDNYSTYVTVADAVLITGGSFSWTVPHTPGGKFRIQIISRENNVSADWSDGNFAIGSATPALALTAPNGGQLWSPGSKQDITWTSNLLSGNVLIRLWNNMSSYTVVDEVPIYSGTYSWTVPNTPGCKFRIQIISRQNSACADWSDANFTIGSATPSIALTAPNGGQIWTAGTTQSITWTTSALGGNVRIRLWDNMSSYVLLPEAPIGAGSCPWTVPNTPGTKYRIQLISTANSAYADWSDANFSISSP